MDDLRTDEVNPETEIEQKPAESPSAVRKVFQNRFGHWRAGWRILLYIAVLVGFTIGLQVLVGFFFEKPDDVSMASWLYILFATVSNLALVVSAFLVLKLFDRRPVSLLGIGFERRWLVELMVGVAAGIVSTGALALLLVLTGQVEMSVSPRVGEAIEALPRYLALFTVAGALEEFVFRGYLLQALAEGSRRWLAAVLLSLTFAVVHLGNPDLSVVGVVNIFLIGVVIAITYFQTLRLWLPIGYHLSWNWAHGCLWGFDVSGIEIEHKLLEATPVGPEIVTGGGFGLEGSIFTTVAIIAVGAWLLTKRVLAPVPEIAAKWAPYPTGFGKGPETDGVESSGEGAADALAGDGFTPDSTA